MLYYCIIARNSTINNSCRQLMFSTVSISYNTNQCRTSDLDSIQLHKDVDDFMEWSQAYLLNENYKLNARGWELQYLIEDGEQLNFISHEKDLGIIVDHQFKFHLHTASVASKVNWILGIVSESLPWHLFLTKALVHSVIEHANSIWVPFFIGHKRMAKKRNNAPYD